MKMLSMCVGKFPQSVVDAHANLLFVPLAVRLVNEDSKPCRVQVANLLQQLLSAVSQSTCIVQPIVFARRPPDTLQVFAAPSSNTSASGGRTRPCRCSASPPRSRRCANLHPSRCHKPFSTTGCTWR